MYVAEISADADAAVAAAVECGDEVALINDEVLMGRSRDEVQDLLRGAGVSAEECGRERRVPAALFPCPFQPPLHCRTRSR